MPKQPGAVQFISFERRKDQRNIDIFLHYFLGISAVLCCMLIVCIGLNTKMLNQTTEFWQENNSLPRIVDSLICTYVASALIILLVIAQIIIYILWANVSKIGWYQLGMIIGTFCIILIGFVPSCIIVDDSLKDSTAAANKIIDAYNLANPTNPMKKVDQRHLKERAAKAFDLVNQNGAMLVICWICYLIYEIVVTIFFFVLYEAK